jgi:hypothetical protein
VPTTEDPRTCLQRDVVRWLSVLDQADGVSRHDAYRALATASAPTLASEHVHTLAAPQGWRLARSLLSPIDQRGWIDDYHPVLSLHSIGSRLAAAQARKFNAESVSAESARAARKPAARGPTAPLDATELFALLGRRREGCRRTQRAHRSAPGRGHPPTEAGRWPPAPMTVLPFPADLTLSGAERVRAIMGARVLSCYSVDVANFVWSLISAKAGRVFSSA